MAKMRQTDKIDEEQFDEEEIEDEYRLGDIGEDEQEEEDDEEVKSKMGDALSSFKLSSGAIIVTVLVLVALIVAIIFFKPFSGEGGDGEGFSIGKFFGRDGSLGSDILGGEVNATMSYADSLIQYLEGYEVEDVGDGTYVVTGTKDELPHIMVYDGNFNMLSETIGEETIAYVLDEETGEMIPTTPLTATNTSIPEQTAEIAEGEDMVKVDRWSYEHSNLGMKPSNPNIEYDDNGIAITTSYTDKFLVEYQKLPLRGQTAQVFVKILDTDIELIFSLSISSYLSMPDSGASMITARVTEVGGEQFFDNISFTKWK